MRRRGRRETSFSIILDDSLKFAIMYRFPGQACPRALIPASPEQHGACGGTTGLPRDRLSAQGVVASRMRCRGARKTPFCVQTADLLKSCVLYRFFEPPQPILS